MELRELIEQDGNFSWLPEDAFEILEGCFDLREERIPAGESREAAGSIGYLLRGNGRVDGVQSGPGTLLGLGKDRKRMDAVLTAETDCRVFWLDYEVMDGACYRACWFHARLMEELEKLAK